MMNRYQGNDQRVKQEVVERKQNGVDGKNREQIER